MDLLVFPVTKQNSLIPTVCKFSKINCNKGFNSIPSVPFKKTGAISLGNSFVKGRSRVPFPAQVITDFKQNLFCYFVYRLYSSKNGGFA
jgi:hypothetical protein